MSDHRDFIDPTTGELDTAGLMAAFDNKAEELSALEYKLRQSAKSEVALRRELARQHSEGPHAEQVREVLEYWLAKCHKSSRTKIPMDGARAQKVRSRLNQGFTVDDLKEAVDGCARLPFVGPHGRVATNAAGTQRQDDIELICRDETYVERFRGYAKQPIDLREHRDKQALERGVENAERRAEKDEQRREQGREKILKYGDGLAPMDRVTHALQGAGLKIELHQNRPDSLQAQCPAHDDKDPSLTVRRDPDGKLWIKCWAGCDKETILARLGLQWRDLWDGSERDQGALNSVYRDESKPALPAELRRELERLLGREERKAA